jgi:polyhydroxyalkanoate synthesis repressor PhaR
MITIKKYSNRRLYDTAASEYITLEELADRIREGYDVEVVDASSGEDITQRVLAQIILESRGAARMLPVPLLMRLIRMGDDRLTEFFGQFMSWSLELYLQAKEGAETMYGPFTNLPGPAGKWMQAMFERAPGMGPSDFDPPVSPTSAPEHESDAGETGGEPPPPGTSTDGASPQTSSDPTPSGEGESLADMRREVDELKNLIQQMASDGDTGRQHRGASDESGSTRDNEGDDD